MRCGQMLRNQAGPPQQHPRHVAMVLSALQSPGPPSPCQDLSPTSHSFIISAFPLPDSVLGAGDSGNNKPLRTLSATPRSSPHPHPTVFLPTHPQYLSGSWLQDLLWRKAALTPQIKIQPAVSTLLPPPWKVSTHLPTLSSAHCL